MRKLTDTYRGFLVYMKIVKSKKGTFFVLLTDDDGELNYYAIEHLNRCAAIKGFKKAEIICCERIREGIEPYARNRYPINYLDDKRAQALISYIMMKFTAGYHSVLPNIRMISLENDTAGYKMLSDIGAFDKEYLVWNRMMFTVYEYGEFIRAKKFEKRS